MNILYIYNHYTCQIQNKKNTTNHSILIHSFYDWRLEELKNMTHRLQKMNETNSEKPQIPVVDDTVTLRQSSDELPGKFIRDIIKVDPLCR